MLKSFSTLESEEITSLAIGGFDGIHRAHDHLLSQLDEKGALLIVEKGFDQALTPGKERCRHTKHNCFFLDFQEIREMCAEDFLAFLHRHFPALRKIVVGYDFRFGKERKGTPEDLKKVPHVEVVVVEEQKSDALSIHANTIRTLLKQGEIEKASRLLGRPYAIYGRVVPGQGLGKRALYPTFNLDPGNYLLPAEGVYVSEAVTGDGATYPAVTFVGKRLSTDGAFSVETHLLTDENVTSQERIEVRFFRFLRRNRKFEKLSDLKKQIGEDIRETKRYFQAGS